MKTLKIEDCAWPNHIGKRTITHKAPSSDDENEAGDGTDDTASVDDDYELDDIHAHFLTSNQAEEEVNPMLDGTTVMPYVEHNSFDCIIA